MASLVLPEYYADLATTTLSSSYTAGAGSIVVTSAAALSTTRQFHFMITDQTTGAVKAIGKATAVSTNTFTVTMTTDANAASGDFVTITQCAAAMNQIRSDISQVGPIASAPTTALQGDRYKCTDAPYDGVYNSGAWQWFYRELPATLPPSSGWTNVNITSADYTNGMGYLIGTNNSGPTTICAQYRAAPSTPYSIIARFDQDASGIIGGLAAGGSLAPTTVAGFFIGWRDSAGKYLGLVWNNSSPTAPQLYLVKYNDTTTDGASSVLLSGAFVKEMMYSATGGWIVRITNDGTNLKIALAMASRAYAATGWQQIHTETITTFLANANSVLYGMMNNGSGCAVSLFDWTQQ